MVKSLPKKASVGVRGKSAEIDTATYFLAKRMEGAGMLVPGQALMLAATARTTKPKRKAR